MIQLMLKSLGKANPQTSAVCAGPVRRYSSPGFFHSAADRASPVSDRRPSVPVYACQKTDDLRIDPESAVILNLNENDADAFANHIGGHPQTISWARRYPLNPEPRACLFLSAAAGPA